jgi:hypothetical protein
MMTTTNTAAKLAALTAERNDLLNPAIRAEMTVEEYLARDAALSAAVASLTEAEFEALIG